MVAGNVAEWSTMPMSMALVHHNSLGITRQLIHPPLSVYFVESRFHVNLSVSIL